MDNDNVSFVVETLTHSLSFCTSVTLIGTGQFVMLKLSHAIPKPVPGFGKLNVPIMFRTKAILPHQRNGLCAPATNGEIIKSSLDSLDCTRRAATRWSAHLLSNSEKHI
jgi:hypothetical protein